MNREHDRRLFLKAGASIAASTIAWNAPNAFAQVEKQPESANEKLTIGVMGVNGRGGNIIKGMMALPNTEIRYVCDVDTHASDRAASYVEKRGARNPRSSPIFDAFLMTKTSMY